MLAAVLTNAAYWVVLPAYGVEAPPWFVIGINVVFIVHLFWVLLSAGGEMGEFPSVDESLDRLRRAGWSIGETAGVCRWLVTGSNGENIIHAEGQSQAEAWSRAPLQVEAVDRLAAPRGEPGHARNALYSPAWARRIASYRAIVWPSCHVASSQGRSGPPRSAVAHGPALPRATAIAGGT